MSIIACSIENCEKPKRGQHGWCPAHWMAWKRYGDPTINRKSGRKVCTIDGCEAFVHGNGLCTKHWCRVDRTGDPMGVRKPGCSGAANPAWAGESVTYLGAHARVQRLRGSAKDYACVDCGNKAYDWSYNHADKDELMGALGNGTLAPFSLKIECYEPRCRSCHRYFDNSVDRSAA